MTTKMPGKPLKPLNSLCIFCINPSSRSLSRHPSTADSSPRPRPFRLRPPALTPLNLYFSMTSLISATSALCYLASPSQALTKLGGTTSPSALVLVQVVASGEALVSYLCLEGLFSNIPESRRLVVRAIGVYNLFHMGAFWWGHRKYMRNPKGTGMLAFGLFMGTATSLWYGIS